MKTKILVLPILLLVFCILVVMAAAQAEKEGENELEENEKKDEIEQEGAGQRSTVNSRKLRSSKKGSKGVKPLINTKKGEENDEEDAGEEGEVDEEETEDDGYEGEKKVSQDTSSGNPINDENVDDSVLRDPNGNHIMKKAEAMKEAALHEGAISGRKAIEAEYASLSEHFRPIMTADPFTLGEDAVQKVAEDCEDQEFMLLVQRMDQLLQNERLINERLERTLQCLDPNSAHGLLALAGLQDASSDKAIVSHEFTDEEKDEMVRNLVDWKDFHDAYLETIRESGCLSADASIPYHCSLVSCLFLLLIF